MTIKQGVFDLRQFPEWCAAEAVLQRLNGERDSLSREIADSLRTRIEVGDSRDQRAQALIDRAATGADLNIAETFKPAPVSDVQAGLYRSLHDLEAAIVKHRRGMAELRAELSKKILKAQRPAYVEILRRLLDSLKALEAVTEEEREFGEAVNDNGVSWSTMNREVWRHLGRLDDPSSFVAMFVKEVERDYPELRSVQSRLADLVRHD